MRPARLDPLFASAESLDGIGPKTAKLLARIVPADLGDRDLRVGDLMFTLPNSVIDRRNRPGIALSPEGAIVTLDLRIDRHQPPPQGRPNIPYRVFGHDETGEISLAFFGGKQPWLEKLMPVGENVTVSGRMEWFNGRPSMVHPDHIIPQGSASTLPEIEPVYPLTAGLTDRLVRKAISAALAKLPDFPEWLSPEIRMENGFPGFAEALRSLHAPTDPAAALPDSPGWRRLAFDEFVAGQLALALVRRSVKRLEGTPLAGDGKLRAAIRAALPFELTASQQAAIGEIAADMARSERMLRLLQGDVGAGKTVVALMAMAHAAESGAQSVLMAPTEILARQHAATLGPLAEKAGIKLAVLTGREKGRERETILAGLANGDIAFAIGTHALFQEGVAFRDLALAVIDEQHRFGVHQRLAMTAKGRAPHMLVMTATPIPRTLVLTAYGDMDVSRLTEKPAGRRPIQTVVLPAERLDDLLRRLRDAVAAGQQVYWICPLVEDAGNEELVSAEKRFEDLSKLFPNKTGLVHGRLSGTAKDAAMAAFKAGETRVLVATTVVEVGVDVPGATIMVIENAERFGLAQLHQLRGRVGRSDKPSSCILLYSGPLGETAQRRLETMRQTEDGFLIAEEDLRLRGEGDILGSKQSGLPGFLVARIEVHAGLLAEARREARSLLDADPELASPRGSAARDLLYVFGRDDAIRFLSAG